MKNASRGTKRNCVYFRSNKALDLNIWSRFCREIFLPRSFSFQKFFFPEIFPQKFVSFFLIKTRRFRLKITRKFSNLKSTTSECQAFVYLNKKTCASKVLWKKKDRKIFSLIFIMFTKSEYGNISLKILLSSCPCLYRVKKTVIRRSHNVINKNYETIMIRRDYNGNFRCHNEMHGLIVFFG